jgi:hypothetical protein
MKVDLPEPDGKRHAIERYDPARIEIVDPSQIVCFDERHGMPP